MRRILSLFLALIAVLAASAVGQAQTTPDPTSVTIAGSFQDELGCPSDWAPDCALTALAFNEIHQLWVGTFDLPAGSFEYKAALNGSWDENYGLNAEPGGANIPLNLTAPAKVTFLYDHKTNYTADNVTRIIANLPGNFNNLIGCPNTAFDDPGNPGNWAPDCWQTLLQDPDGDGVYTFATNRIPPGNYEVKVAVNGSWSENYGDGGAPGGANIGFTVAKEGADVLFSWNATTKLLTISAEGAPKGNLSELGAYWVDPATILTPLGPENSYTLHYAPAGGLTIGENGLTGGEAFPLTPGGALDSAVAAKFPHLARLTVLRLPAEAVARAGELLRGQLALDVIAPDGAPVTAVGLQLPGVLDALYTYDGPLGVSWDGDVPTVRVWAPTAQTVRLLRFADATGDATAVLDMQRDDATGVWSITGEPGWKNQYYLFEVTVYAPSETAVVVNRVTDPYSLGLSLNSTRSRFVDLRDPAWQPSGWAELAKPPLDAPEDIVIYELHIRDFSVWDETVPAEARGTYLAFTYPDSNGMRHLRALADAGLTHLHLLPTFDIATINENKAEWRAPLQRYLAGFPADSEQQQQAVNTLRDADGFNWGYDPFHYTAPEGSYAVNPDARILEYRQMVQAVNQAGLRLVMDVVYNHTNAAGQGERSVLDRVVPGYYHRLNSKGRVENSTCCANTATEHNMMRKLMFDSLRTWAVEYKVDAFRFDLMGHHMLADMQAVRAMLDGLTLERDGVDGRAIYVYGEGWNFGEVADNARGVNATQRNVGGLGIGTFNDRLRDAARGGNPFGGEHEQGFASGLYTNPNATDQGPQSLQLARLLLFSDQVRVGLAGNLADYQFQGYTGATVTGAQVDYNGSPAGYTLDPQENIIYVSKHDNQTLYDTLTYKLPVETSMADRVRHQNLALDIVMFSQGVPFFHAGSDMLRSKSFDRDSYNSGDWFNALDFSYQDNGFGRGLPIADKNQNNWPIIRPLLANPDLKPDQTAILANVAHFREMLQVRRSSPLFRLRTAEDVQTRLRFWNTGPDQIPGLIVMSLDDLDPAAKLDAAYDRIVVLFNGTPDAIDFSIAELAQAELTLHPVLAQSADPIVRTAAFADGVFSVPARTTAVFVEPTTLAVAPAPTPGSAQTEAPAPTPAPTAEPTRGDFAATNQPAPWLALGAGLALLGVMLFAYLRRFRRP